ncbi:MAG: hypothetical protein WCV58_04365 [Patescibacteria group bacterium]
METGLVSWFIPALTVYVIGALITYGILDTSSRHSDDAGVVVTVTFLWPLAIVIIVLYYLCFWTINLGRFLGKKFG